MNKVLPWAAVLAALSACAAAQDSPAGASLRSGCIDERPRAASVLPARASTKPAPELGSVAPNTRVPSHADTPSARAMRAARAKDQAQTDPGGAPQTPTQHQENDKRD